MPKVGDDVTYIDENGQEILARVTEVRTEGKDKKDVLNIQYFGKGTVLKVNAVTHISVRPDNAEGQKVCCYK